jgi:hypothetical protein
MSTPDEQLDADLFALVCMLVSSARGALEEGPYTASLRLIHAAEQLGSIASRLAPHTHGDFFARIAAEVGAEATASYLASAEAYEAFLDRAVRTMALEVRRDNGL